ncbi:hypothetical protein [Cohnella sp. OV330]|uniref:hypothetical protein n=1 Tax=Cohnella sp. OV330 TaxID=1855288 RepID=UPI001160CE5C|nr:hypothetical protein [Cohnella sp. OV330]
MPVAWLKRRPARSITLFSASVSTVRSGGGIRTILRLHASRPLDPGRRENMEAGTRRRRNHWPFLLFAL